MEAYDELLIAEKESFSLLLLKLSPFAETECARTGGDGEVSRNITGYQISFGHQALHLLLHFTHPQLITTIADSYREEEENIPLQPLFQN